MTPDAPQDATESDETSRTVFRDRGEIIAALTARNAELEATLAKVAALADEWEREAGAPGGHSLLVQTYGGLARSLRATLASAGRPATSDEEDVNGEEVDYGWMTGRLSAPPASPMVAPSAADEDVDSEGFLGLRRYYEDDEASEVTP